MTTIFVGEWQFFAFFCFSHRKFDFKFEILHSMGWFSGWVQWIEGNVEGAVAPIFLLGGSFPKANSTLITMVSLLFIDSIGNRAKNGIVFDPGNRPGFWPAQADKLSSRAEYDAVWIKGKVFSGVLWASRHGYRVRIVVARKYFENLRRDLLFSRDQPADIVFIFVPGILGWYR